MVGVCFMVASSLWSEANSSQVDVCLRQDWWCFHVSFRVQHRLQVISSFFSPSWQHPKSTTTDGSPKTTPIWIFPARPRNINPPTRYMVVGWFPWCIWYMCVKMLLYHFALWTLVITIFWVPHSLQNSTIRLRSNLNDPHAFGKQHLEVMGKCTPRVCSSPISSKI